MTGSWCCCVEEGVQNMLQCVRIFSCLFPPDLTLSQAAQGKFHRIRKINDILTAEVTWNHVEFIAFYENPFVLQKNITL